VTSLNFSWSGRILLIFSLSPHSRNTKMSVTLHTSLGPIKLELFVSSAPRTCFNFLALASSSYYDNTIFHRNIKQFCIQGGDPKGTGKGGESIWGGAFGEEFHVDNTHDRRGVVSMANRGTGTNTSQFFITYERQPHLNNVYTVFGRVLEGWETLDKMEALKNKDGKKNRPVDPPVIKGVEIHANPLADQEIVYPSKDGPPERTN